MRKLFIGLAVCALALVGAPSANAGTLTSASFDLALGTLPPAHFQASGLSAGTASGTGGTAAWNVATGAVPGGTLTTTIPSSAAPPISQIQFVINSNPTAGGFAASSGGTMLVTGVANVKGFGGLTLLPVGVQIGAPGVNTILAYGIGITAIANGWTTKTASVVLTTPTSQGATKATAMGGNFLAGGAGTVVLVSALNVLTSIAGQLPTFAVLTLNYSAPEPGTLLLLGSGVAGLVIAGRRRNRK